MISRKVNKNWYLQIKRNRTQEDNVKKIKKISRYCEGKERNKAVTSKEKENKSVTSNRGRKYGEWCILDNAVGGANSCFRSRLIGWSSQDI